MDDNQDQTADRNPFHQSIPVAPADLELPEDSWRWVERDDIMALVDATGQAVPLNGRARRLIEVAPRMAAVLHRLLEQLADIGDRSAAAARLVDIVDGVPPPEPTALLTLIHEAQAAGRARGTFQAPEDQRVAARAVYLEEALNGMVKAWDHFTADTSCPVCAVDLQDGGVHPPKTGPGMEHGDCPRAFAQQILDGVEP